MEEVAHMKKILASMLCLFLLAGFTVVAGCQKAEEKKVSQAPAVTQAPAFEEKQAAEVGKVTITGTVNDQGNIVADDGKEYVIAGEDMRKELMGKVDKKVKATGTVEEREGKMLIEVTSYEVIEE
ncbi:MAG: hypothetical protein ACETWT_15300 [Thermodesulfobacteriota bacterium]